MLVANLLLGPFSGLFSVPFLMLLNHPQVLGSYMKANPDLFLHLILGAVVICIVAFEMTVLISYMSSWAARKIKPTEDEGYTSLNHISPYSSLR